MKSMLILKKDLSNYTSLNFLLADFLGHIPLTYANLLWIQIVYSFKINILCAIPMWVLFQLRGRRFII